MNPIRLNKDGQLSTKTEAFFGGAYNTFEKIKLGGIGSPKLIYHEGITSFDQLRRGLHGEVPFVNFSLLKNGLILRLNINQRQICVGQRLDHINAVNLIAYRISVKVPNRKTKIVHRGSLEIIHQDGQTKFSIVTRQFASILQFFQKPPLKEKFHHSISTNPPEEDYGHLLWLLSPFL